jgi:hypothetical protein
VDKVSFSKQLLKDLEPMEEVDFSEVFGGKYGKPEASKKL